MDCWDYGSALLGEFFQEENDLKSSGWIKSRSWLIEENYTRVCDKFNAYRRAFSLSSRYSLDKGVSYFSISAWTQP